MDKLKDITTVREGDNIFTFLKEQNKEGENKEEKLKEGGGKE